LHPITNYNNPKGEIRRFQLFATLTMDHIWFVRNKLIHDAVVPIPTKILKHLLFFVDMHISTWNDKALHSLWDPPPLGNINANFDVTVRGNLSVAIAIISDSFSNIIMAATKELLSHDILQGKASADLLASRLAVLSGFYNLFLEWDALLVVLAINSHSLFSSWSFSNIVSDISLVLS
jgi:hypothetical protein